MKTLLNLLCVCLLASFAGAALANGTPDGDPPSVEDICNDLQWISGPAFGLCNAYCEAMDCDCGNAYNPDCTPNANPTACMRVLDRFSNRTSGGVVPCEPSCGNGIVDDGEDCDDGNNIDGDGCSSMCQLEGPVGFCGDGTIDGGEECDDGGNDSGDGCTPDCEIECPCNIPPHPLVPNAWTPADGFTRWQELVGSPLVNFPTPPYPFPFSSPATGSTVTPDTCTDSGTVVTLQRGTGAGDPNFRRITADSSALQCTAEPSADGVSTYGLTTAQANACRNLIKNTWAVLCP